MCYWWFERVHIYSDISLLRHFLHQHKETIRMNLKFKKSSKFYFILYYFITSYIINIKNCHNNNVSEYRPSLVRDILWADGTLRTCGLIHCMRLVLTWISKKYICANPRITLWTFGFSYVYLVWFLAPKWYFVWTNWVNLSYDLNGESEARGVVKKINSKPNFLWRQSNYLTYSSRRLLCNALIQTHLYK